MTSPEDLHDRIGPLGMSYDEIGSVVQHLATVLLDRGFDEDDVIARLQFFDEGSFWEDVGGPAVDSLADALGLTHYPEE